MMNFIKKNWLWLLLGGGAVYFLVLKKPATTPLPPQADDTPGTPEFEIRSLAAPIAVAKGWSGTTDIWVTAAGQVRVIFNHSQAGKAPEMATYNNMDDALSAARAGHIW